MNLNSSRPFAKGVYIAYVKYEDGSKRQPVNITMASYSLDKPDFKKLSRQTFKESGFLAKCLMSHAYQSSRHMAREKQYEIRSNFLDGSRGEFGYVLVSVLVEATKKVKLEVSAEDFEKIGLVLKKPFKRTRKGLVLNAGQNAMIICRQTFASQATAPSMSEFRFPPNMAIRESVD